MIEKCDNTFACHTLELIAEDANASRSICTTCKEQFVVRKDWRGVHLNRQYIEVFRKETLQPNQNLFYKYYPKYLRT